CCAEYNVPLMVDEAHSLGVLGATRTGAAELFGVAHDVDIRMGALSKGMGATGGFIAGSRDLTDSLRLHARAFLFSTSGVPAALGAALAAVRLQRSEEGAELAARALSNARLLRELLTERGIVAGGMSVLPGGETVVAPNIAIVIGEDLAAIEIWKRVFDDGVFCALAVRP
ncbi:aminotransferase class I/II-fold pyridoxal phosphate-dependent enzyme, partial [Nocardia gipuzkoensis]